MDAEEPTQAYLRYWSEVWSDRAYSGVSYDSVSDGERTRIDAIVRLIPTDVRSILDVGCGPGLIANVLVDRGFDVTGIDVSDEALAMVKAKRLRGASDALPVGSGAFDMVIIADVLEHLPSGQFERTLNELDRVAAQYIIVNSPRRESLELARTCCDRCATAFHASRHVRSIDEADLLQWFPAFNLLETVLCGEPRLHRLHYLQLVAQAVGDTWYRPAHAVCPNCGYLVHPRRPKPLVRALNGAIQRAVGALLPSRPSEFVCLLRRNRAAEAPS